MTKDKKNYMENRKIVNLTRDTWEKLDEIKLERDLKSLDSTVEELISLRDELYKKNMIVDKYYCKKCNDKIDKQIDPNVLGQLYKHRHRHIDSSSDCDGHLGKTCGVKIHSDEELRKLADIIETKKARNEQIDTSKEQSDEQADVSEQEEDLDEKYKNFDEETKDVLMKANKEGKYKE